MCISVAFAIIYPFSVEIFPTVIRNNGLAVASAGARVGGFVAPYILILVGTMYSRMHTQLFIIYFENVRNAFVPIVFRDLMQVK